VRTPGSGHGEDVGLTLAAVGGGHFLGAAGLLWLSGQLAALAVHRSWPAAPVAAAPAILLRLAAHPSLPAAAWPPEARTAVPGPLSSATG